MSIVVVLVSIGTSLILLYATTCCCYCCIHLLGVVHVAMMYP